MTWLRVLPWLLALCLGIQAFDSRAATTCTAQVSAVAFGNVSPTAATDTTATINVTCNTGALSLLATASVTVCLNIGEGAQGGGLGITPRRLVNAQSDTLQMQLYKDSARTQVWGSNLVTSSATPLQFNLSYDVPLLGGTGTISQTIYARIPLQSGLAVGSDYINQFNGGTTLLQYRYNEVLLGIATPPASCLSGGTGGGTAPLSFNATANVASQCSISAASDLDFSAQPGIFTGNRDYTSTLTMRCRRRTAWQIGLNNGQHASGTTRRMANAAGTAFVPYEMYRNSPRTQRWGNTLNTDTLTGTGSGNSENFTIYGRVPGPQNLVPGSYSDIVTVTVTY
jgi:spore coat protein U-like protein